MDSDGDTHIDCRDGWRGETTPGRRDDAAVEPCPPAAAGALATRRVLMVNSVALFAQGLRAMLEATQGFQVVGECRDAADAMAAIATLEPGLILLGDAFPDTDASRLATRIMRQHPGIGVVLLTDRPAPRFGRRGARGAGHACVSRVAGIADLVDVLCRVSVRARAAAAASPRSSRFGQPGSLPGARCASPRVRPARCDVGALPPGQARRSLTRSTH